MDTAIAVNNLQKTYRPKTRKGVEVKALEGISFEVARGEFWWLRSSAVGSSRLLAWSLATIVEPQQIGLVFNVLLAPMIFFGCAYYPWATLHVIPWFQYAVLVNPMVYASEGFRLALTPQMPHMSPWLVYGGLIGFSLLFTRIGIRKFQQRALD